MTRMSRFDAMAQNAARSFTRSSSRRGFIGRLGATLVGSSLLLPVARADAVSADTPAVDPSSPPESYPGVGPQMTVLPGERGDVTSCDYWRYCGIGGNLCSCCGGGPATCPPGTEMSQMAWLGTCLNPVDNKRYIISYNDCCGAPICTRCGCGPANSENKPPVRPQSSNEYLWCLGTSSTSYTCSTANVVGVAVS